MSRTIKAATPEDRTVLLQHWQQLAVYLPEQHSQPFGQLVPEERFSMLENTLDDTLRAKHAQIFLAEEANQILGSVSLVLNQQIGYSQPDSGVIFNLWVEAEFRNNGVGTELVRQGCDWLRSQKADSVQAGWQPSNLTAHGFWQKLGFIPYELIGVRSLQEEAEV